MVNSILLSRTLKNIQYKAINSIGRVLSKNMAHVCILLLNFVAVLFSVQSLEVIALVIDTS